MPKVPVPTETHLTMPPDRPLLLLNARIKISFMSNGKLQIKLNLSKRQTVEATTNERLTQ